MGNARQDIEDHRELWEHHDKRNDGKRRRALLLLTDIRTRLRSASGSIRDPSIEPVVRQGGRRLPVRVDVREMAILGIQEKLQQRVAMRS